ncbi:hypothetical protein GQ457_04G023870 [Hibiscus cannabinus]
MTSIGRRKLWRSFKFYSIFRNGEMTSIGRRTLRRCFKDRRNLKKRKLEKQNPNWSDLPREIIERIIGRLLWVDRIRIRAVCKAWSAPNSHIPAIDKVPWAMKHFYWRPTDNGQIFCLCTLCDPLSGEYVTERSLREEEFPFPFFAYPCASACGWVLFSTRNIEQAQTSLFLYSLFTREVIKLPELRESNRFQVATFSLNATSPKCAIFALCLGPYGSRIIYVQTCFLGDRSWKTLQFNGFNCLNHAKSAVYANGVFYCVFIGGQLCAFNVELQEWTVLISRWPYEFDLSDANLIASDGDLWLLDQTDLECLKLFKFDRLEMRWVYENNLNNRVLFAGCTSFFVPAVGEISRLANTIFCCGQIPYSARCYGSTSPRCTRSRLSRKCVEATKFSKTWIELPLGGVWRAKDLI